MEIKIVINKDRTSADIYVDGQFRKGSSGSSKSVMSNAERWIKQYNIKNVVYEQ